MMNTVNVRNIMQEDIPYPVWHPYSANTKSYFQIINFARGDGIFLYDVNGKRYLDAGSGLWNMALGYNNSKIREYIMRQLENLSYCSLFSYTSPVVVQCANRLLKMLPGYMEKIFFNCSGSDSIEFAIKLMRKYWCLEGYTEKNRIISFKGSYHGTHYGSMSISGISAPFTGGFAPLVGNVVFMQPGVCLDCGQKEQYPGCDLSCTKEVEAYIKTNRDYIAGIMVEPVLASNGVQVLSPRYLEALARVCREQEVLVAFDEVTTGFFRTGTAFYMEQVGSAPDILCLSKGINSGYLPLGATAISGKICRTFKEQNDLFFHGTTQSGNLLACAACLAALEEYSKLNVAENVKEQGGYLRGELAKRLAAHPNVKRIHGLGLMIQIDLQGAGIPLKFNSIMQLNELLRKNGLLVSCSDSGLTLFPILIINRQESDLLLEILADTLKTVRL